MKSMISIVEIPTDDFTRAVSFYQALLGIVIGEVDMQGTRIGLLSGQEESVSVILIKGPDNKPAAEGTTVYLNAGDDLQFVLDRVRPNGGQVLVPKTEIPDTGFFAMFLDTEGNKVGLYSTQ